MSGTFTLGNTFKLRDKVPMEVLRKFRPTEPIHLTVSMPPLDGNEIRSGMVLVTDSGTHEGNAVAAGFRIAQAADALTKREFYLAFHDLDSHDVQASKKMVGFPCREPAEFMSGYYEIELPDAFIKDQWLTVGDGGVLVPWQTDDQAKLARISGVGPLATGAFLAPHRVQAVHVEDTTVIQLVTGVWRRQSVAAAAMSALTDSDDAFILLEIDEEEFVVVE